MKASMLIDMFGVNKQILRLYRRSWAMANRIVSVV